MFARLFLLFAVTTLVELALLLKVADWVSVGPTIALVVATALLGSALARREGLRTLRRIQSELSAGHLPGDPLIEGILILLAGALLITPGLITDAVGFLLLIPPTRRMVRKRVKAHFQGRFRMVGFTSARSPRDDDFIDVEASSPEDD